MLVSLDLPSWGFLFWCIALLISRFASSFLTGSGFFIVFLTKYKEKDPCFYNSCTAYLLVKQTDLWYLVLFVTLTVFPTKEIIY